MALCFLLGQELTFGQQAATDQLTDYNKIIDRFFVQVKAQKYTDAAHVLVDTNPQDAYDVEKHEAVARGLQTISDHFGTFNGFKPLVSRNLNDALGYVYGVGLYDRNPIRFEFIFFKNGRDWRIWRYDFSDNFSDEIRDQVGIHIQNPPSYLKPPASPSTSTPDSSQPAQ